MNRSAPAMPAPGATHLMFAAPAPRGVGTDE
jgi:hypothetical protein